MASAMMSAADSALGTKRLRNQRKSKRKRAQKSAQKKAAAHPDPNAFPVPNISEDDLLAFQLSHFNDDSKPTQWFIDPETALTFTADDMELDELGYYDDGIKRTLTEEQIAMFRHSEVQELLRECRLQREEQEYQAGAAAVDGGGERSPVSDVSSLETDLVDVAKLQSLRPPPPKRQRSQSSRSDTSRSTGSAAKRKRKEEVPYSERKKRNWEQFIEREDVEHGSITQRRQARELDEQRMEAVDMDYGDDGPTQKRAAPSAPGGRRLMSYGDL